MFKLVYSDLRDGFYNTAIDEAIFAKIKKGTAQNTITLTEWKPTVSIGYSQRCEVDVDIQACRRKNIDIVRRYSGGKSVYLDENYIVFSLAASHNDAGKGYLHELRNRPCKSVIHVLNDNGIPAKFFPPDNIVIRKKGGGYMTLGNSGQKVTQRHFYVHGSIRYDLPEYSFLNLIDTLKINGESLHEHKEDARNVLAAVTDHSDMPKEALAEEIAESLAKEFGGHVESRSHLTREEEQDILLIRNEISSHMWLQDRPGYKWRGICYFFLNGNNLLPQMRYKKNPPS